MFHRFISYIRCTGYIYISTRECTLGGFALMALQWQEETRLWGLSYESWKSNPELNRTFGPGDSRHIYNRQFLYQHRSVVYT